jgi:hypothetical protein
MTERLSIGNIYSTNARCYGRSRSQAHDHQCNLSPAEEERERREILSDSAKLMQGIEILVLLSTIQLETSLEGMEDYVCFCASARASYNQDRAFWLYQAFEFCCYIFKAGEYEAPIDLGVLPGEGAKNDEIKIREICEGPEQEWKAGGLEWFLKNLTLSQ